MKLNKIYSMPPDVVESLKDPRYQLVVGLTEGMVVVLDREVRPGSFPEMEVNVIVDTPGFGIFQKDIICHGSTNLEDVRSLNNKDKVTVILQGWKSGSNVKITGTYGWSVGSSEKVRDIRVNEVGLFLRDTVDGSVVPVPVQ